MAGKRGIPAVILIGVAAALASVAIYFGTRPAEAAPEEGPPVVEVPFDVEEMIGEIRQAKSLAELDAYYNYIGEKFILREISYVEYMALYRAYEERWYELTGVTA